MKRFFDCVLMAFLVLFFMVPKGMTQALTLGKVSMTGEVKVTGPGGMVYTSTDREAPLFPGSVIKTEKGQAIVDVTGKGTIIVDKGSCMGNIDENGLPFLKKGNFQVKIPASSYWDVDTPRGVVRIKAGKEMGIFSIFAKEDRVEVVTGRDCVAEAKGENLVYEYDKEAKKYILKGKTYAAAPKAKLLLTDSGKLLAGYIPCCFAAGLEGGEAEGVEKGAKGVTFLDESNVKGNVLSLLEKGTYKIKVPPEAQWSLNTPRGVVKIKAGKEVGIFTVLIKDDRVVVITGKHSLVEASGDNLIYKYDEETKRYVLKGKKYASLPQVNLLLTDSRTLLGGYIPCCYAASLGAARVGAGALPVALLGLTGAAATAVVVSSNNTHEHHRHKASPYKPHGGGHKPFALRRGGRPGLLGVFKNRG